MNETIYIGIIIAESLVILIVGICFYVSLAVISQSKAENDELKNKNKSLVKEIVFQKKVSKTFSDGLKALKQFNK